MSDNGGMVLPVKAAFGHYMTNWYNGLYPNTPSIQSFIERGSAKSIMFVPDRMIDDAEKMIDAYRKSNVSEQGKNSLLPVVLIAVAKDWTPVGEAWGHQVGDRQMVTLTDAPDASVYGYRQAMGEVRTQVAIFAADGETAKALAAQLSLYIGAVVNRRFLATHKWGQYALTMPVVIDTPQVSWANVASGQDNLTILAGDIQLNSVFPFLDAPKAGEENDGSNNVPKGYPVVKTVTHAETPLNPNQVVKAP